MAAILRGEIRLAHLGPTVGREPTGPRPVLVISEDVFNELSGTVLAMLVTHERPEARYPLSLELAATHLARRSWVRMAQVRTLAAGRLGERVGRASAAEMSEVLEGLIEIAGG